MGVVELEQFDIYLVSLDPTKGSEIKKTRPCIIVSPNEINVLRTVMIAPMTTKGFEFPTRIPITFKGKKGLVVLDQIRAIDKSRLVTKLGSVNNSTAIKILRALQEVFAI